MYRKHTKHGAALFVILLMLLAAAVIYNLTPQKLGLNEIIRANEEAESNEEYKYDYTAHYFLPTIRNFIETEVDEDVDDHTPHSSDRDVPLVFIGGFPRSGTTLLRVTLGSHASITCAAETKFIQNILNELTLHYYSPEERIRMKENNLLEATDNGIARIILHIIQNNQEENYRYCIKEPFSCIHQRYLHELFPSSSYILMVRDPRAVLFSIMSKQIYIDGVNCADFRDVLLAWNNVMEAALTQCVGSEKCMMVHYEDLILQPIKTTKSIFKFIDMKWSKDVLYHERFLLNNQTKLSKTEMRDTNDVTKPIYLDGLVSWFRKIPLDILQMIPKYAPVMQLLGYSPYDIEPFYGEPDDFVLKKGIWSEK